MAVSEPNAVVEWKPSVDQVAAILRARTQDDQMQEVGTFTDATRPTDVQVQELIESASAAFAAEAGAAPCTDALALASAGHIALTAALLVELSYFPEQVASSRSPFDQLKELWDAQHEGIVAAVSFSCGAGGSTPDTGGEGGPIAMPRWSYDEPWKLDWENRRAPAAEFWIWCETWVGYSPVPLSTMPPPDPIPVPPEPVPPVEWGQKISVWLWRPQHDADLIQPGDLRLNSSLSSTTVIWVHKLDGVLNDDQSAVLLSLQAGDQLRIAFPADEATDEVGATYDVIDAIDVGSYVELAVAADAAHGDPTIAYGQDTLLRYEAGA
jgi:hypothetical protein